MSGLATAPFGLCAMVLLQSTARCGFIGDHFMYISDFAMDTEDEKQKKMISFQKEENK